MIPRNDADIDAQRQRSRTQTKIGNRLRRHVFMALVVGAFFSVCVSIFLVYGVEQYLASPQGQQQQAIHHSDIIELSAVVMFRVDFKQDLLKFSRAEVEQWISYISFAGVQHFYVYDNCHTQDECQTWLEDDPRVTYTHHPTTQAYQETQISAYIHHLNRKGPKSRFEIILDIDEYPFMPNDTARGFLLRFAQTKMDEETDQVLLQTMFFVGSNETTHPWRVMRYFHRDEKVIDVGRTKALYRPEMVDPDRSHQHKIWMIHWLSMLPKSKTYVNKGDPKDPSVSRLKVDPSIIRLNHYWCERGKTGLVFDDSIRGIIEHGMGITESGEGYS